MVERDLTNPQHLWAYLSSWRIPITLWGSGSSKTFEHLRREILLGEAVLVEDGNVLVRELRLVRIAVFHNTNEGKTLQLCEEKQVFKNGRVRTRGFKHIGEKMKSCEQASFAARRALSEELGIVDDVVLTDHSVSKLPQEDSKSYPGLPTRIVAESFVTFIPEHLYKPEGYKEEQEDKTTYFVWQEVIKDVATPPQ